MKTNKKKNKRINGQYYFDWLTITLHRPLLFKDLNYRIKIINYVLKSLPQTEEVKMAISSIIDDFKLKNGLYEQQLSKIGIRITCGVEMLRIEFQGLPFNRTPDFFCHAINVYYQIWIKTKIVHNDVEYDPPRITVVHICKDFINKKVSAVLPMATESEYEFRFKHKFKPILRNGIEMEGYHLTMGDYLLKAYRKDWEVLDNSYKSPIKFNIQKNIYGDHLQKPITRVELEVNGGKANEVLTHYFLNIFRQNFRKKNALIKVNRVSICKKILRKFFNYHRVLVVEKRRKRDWKVEKRWNSFFYSTNVFQTKKTDIFVKLNTKELVIKKIKQHLSIASKHALLNSIDLNTLTKDLEDRFSSIQQDLNQNEISEQEILTSLSEEIRKKELNQFK